MIRMGTDRTAFVIKKSWAEVVGGKSVPREVALYLDLAETEELARYLAVGLAEVRAKITSEWAAQARTEADRLRAEADRLLREADRVEKSSPS